MDDLRLWFSDESRSVSFDAIGKTVPRKGELITTHILSGMTEEERAEWPAQALANAESLLGRTFEVVQVLHSFRKRKYTIPSIHVVMITIKEVEI